MTTKTSPIAYHLIHGLIVLLPLAATAGCDGRATPASSAEPIIEVQAADAPRVPEIRLQTVTSHTFKRPIFVGHAGDGSNRLFVVEQLGRIKVMASPESTDKPKVFLDLRDPVHMGHNEEGLLSLVFHPKFKDNGRLFVYYSAEEPRRGVLASFQVDAEDPNRADPKSKKVILEIDQPWGNHNGSTILFGPDGYLYFSLGDGGWAADPLKSGQDLSTLLGTVLRLDVDTPADGKLYSSPKDNPFVGRDGARSEIWAYGLRNVWRMSFDRETGDLWAGDVGQNRWEEIDLIVKGGNYGWNIHEGNHLFQEKLPDDAPTCIAPVVEYDRSQGMSITGGYVYRGGAFASLHGIYFYADYVSGRVWGLRHENNSVAAHRQVLSPDRKAYISSFGEDEAGELYVTTFDIRDRRGGIGRVLRVVPASE